jgi:hypothetical protein
MVFTDKLLVTTACAGAPVLVELEGSTNPSSSGNWVTVPSVAIGKFRLPSEGVEDRESTNLLAVNDWLTGGPWLNGEVCTPSAGFCNGIDRGTD